jgi:hypothetical protein
VSHPRVQFSVRRLMLVVLIVAALLTAFEVGRRWERAHKAGHAGFDPFDPMEHGESLSRLGDRRSSARFSLFCSARVS